MVGMVVVGGRWVVVVVVVGGGGGVVVQMKVNCPLSTSSKDIYKFMKRTAPDLGSSPQIPLPLRPATNCHPDLENNTA
jgi:hypothetical protein